MGKKIQKTRQFILEQNARFDVNIAQAQEADARAVERMRPVYEAIDKQASFDWRQPVEEKPPTRLRNEEAKARRQQLRAESDKSMVRLIELANSILEDREAGEGFNPS